MYTEDQLLPLSAVSQYVHCPRRFALLQIEQLWEDNIFTAEGTVLHEKVDSGIKESRGDLRILRSLRLKSLRLGVTGITDVVELHKTPPEGGGVVVPRLKGTWLPFPVEYKRGASKNIESFAAQLCLQALCLEEMLQAKITHGALFLGTKQQRTAIEFTPALRTQVESACLAMHRLVAEGITPLAEYSKKCQSCSIIDLCQPRICNTKSAKRWLRNTLENTLK